MSDTMTTEMPAPITQGQPIYIAPEDKGAADVFNKARQELGLDQPVEEKKQADPKPEKKEAPKESDVPDDILMGIPDKAKKQEAAPDEDEEILTKRPEGQIKHDHFAKVQETAQRKIAAEREQRAALEKRITEFEEKLKNSSTSAEAAANAEKLAKELADRDELLSKIAFERTPRFREQFTAREEAIKAQVGDTLKELGADADVAQQLINSSGKRRFEALDALDIPESAKAAISTLLINHDSLQRDKADAIAKSRERMTEWEAEQKGAAQAQEERRIAEEKRIFAEAGEEVAKEFEPFMRIDGNEKWNTNVSNLEKEAERYLHGECEFKELSKIVRYGVGAKWQHDNLVVPLRAKLKQVMEENAKLKGVGPGSSSRVEPAKEGGGAKPNNGRITEQDHKDTFSRFMSEARNNGFNP